MRGESRGTNGGPGSQRGPLQAGAAAGGWRALANAGLSRLLTARAPRSVDARTRRDARVCVREGGAAAGRRRPPLAPCFASITAACGSRARRARRARRMRRVRPSAPPALRARRHSRDSDTSSPLARRACSVPAGLYSCMKHRYYKHTIDGASESLTALRSPPARIWASQPRSSLLRARRGVFDQCCGGACSPRGGRPSPVFARDASGPA